MKIKTWIGWGILAIFLLVFETVALPAFAAGLDSLSADSCTLRIEDFGGSEKKTPLKDAAFSVTAVGIRKEDGTISSCLPGMDMTDKKLTDSAFAKKAWEAVKKSKADYVSYEMTTDDKGEATLRGLRPAIYLVAPVKNPTGWTAQDPWFVELPVVKDGRTSRTLVVEPKNQLNPPRTTGAAARVTATPTPKAAVHQAAVVKTGDIGGYCALLAAVIGSAAAVVALAVRRNKRGGDE
ncbi:MAG: SpaA isopeptide-forming pilin-related protein [Lachnospiraceae bacterium]|nr:SpaA isopeptide-forming pilin-related protein [Lachnospiraceae bacterium]